MQHGALGIDQRGGVEGPLTAAGIDLPLPRLLQLGAEAGGPYLGAQLGEQAGRGGLDPVAQGPRYLVRAGREDGFDGTGNGGVDAHACPRSRQQIRCVLCGYPVWSGPMENRARQGFSVRKASRQEQRSWLP